jgi:DNA modification methylase
MRRICAYVQHEAGGLELMVTTASTPDPHQEETGRGTDAAARIAYRTPLGVMIEGKAEQALTSDFLSGHLGKVQLIFTSPPFPLNKKKRYGNLQGDEYQQWLASMAPLLRNMLAPDGSIVIELGNAWEPGRPVMSTLALRSLLAFQDAAHLSLCQQFVAHNPARLPTPAQWVTVERIRVKDTFTNIWWLAPSDRPKADNRRVLSPYSKAMKQLLKRQGYNAGRRPSEHYIGQTSFLTDHGGAIPPNVLNLPGDDVTVPSNLLSFSNTMSTDTYQSYCRDKGLEAHPARMSSGIVEFFVRFLTEENDLVLDPFAGSNTTGSIAESLSRRWISVEPKREYILGSLGRFASGVEMIDEHNEPLRTSL